MKQKTALYLALGLTTFILVAIASVALAWPALKPSSTDAQAGGQDTNLPTITTSTQPESPSDANQTGMDVQSLLDALESREATYQAQIEQANQQLNEAYQQLQELKAQNQLLLEREQTYRQRLQESAQIIEALSAQTSSSAVAGSEEQKWESEHEEHDDHNTKEVHDRDYDDDHDEHHDED